MRLKTFPRLLGVAVLAGLMASNAVAGKRETRIQEPMDQVYDQQMHGALGVRYPGDVATPVGNYHVRGGRKVPYIERCHWTYDLNQLGLPTHFRQVCRRYYGRPLN